MQYTRSYHVPKMKKFLLLLLLGGISQVGVAQTAPAKKSGAEDTEGAAGGEEARRAPGKAGGHGKRQAAFPGTGARYQAGVAHTCHG